jgi:2-hydroxychromene-2-carboxylate isomerase
MALEVAFSAQEQPVFYYDLGSVECYLVAEQVLAALPAVPEWQPVLASSLGELEHRIDRPSIERVALDLGLQPVRWPASLPPRSRHAMLAATYAKQIGRGVAFSLAAFRQVFAGGHDLGCEDTILMAGAACEMHPAALLKALERASLDQALQRATDRARERGIGRLPAIGVGDQVFAGADLLARAQDAMRRAAAAATARP